MNLLSSFSKRTHQWLREVELPAQHHPTRWTGTAEPRPASCPSSPPLSFESLSLASTKNKKSQVLLSLSVRPPLRSRRSFMALIQHQPPWLFTSHLVSILFSVVWSAGTLSLLTCKSITPQMDFVRLPVASEPMKPFSHTLGASLPPFPHFASKAPFNLSGFFQSPEHATHTAVPGPLHLLSPQLWFDIPTSRLCSRLRCHP